MKLYYDKNANFAGFSDGDPVWFRNPVKKQGISLKLQRPWKGCYIVVEKFNVTSYTKYKKLLEAKPRLCITTD